MLNLYLRDEELHVAICWAVFRQRTVVVFADPSEATRILPFTCSVSVGVDVPMPTLVPEVAPLTPLMLPKTIQLLQLD